jgi:glycosyltransferase involved in cell wall biosynthesis
VDAFFVVNYWKGKWHDEENDFRFRLMKALQKARTINARVGFVGAALPAAYRGLKQPRLRLREYLAAVSTARVGIYVRGLWSCLSFKFGQLLAMGMPIVGQTIRANREAIMDNRHFDVQFAYDEPEAIADRVAELLSRPDELSALGAANARTFDTKFTPETVVNGMLERLLPGEITHGAENAP